MTLGLSPMRCILSLGLLLACLCTSAQAGLLANLYDDYTVGSNPLDEVTTFNENGWKFATGFLNPVELTYDSALTDTEGSDTRNPPGFGGNQLFDTALVSEFGVFDNASPNVGELVFHPGNIGGEAGDLIISWTADRNFADLSIFHELRAPNTGNGVGYALNVKNSVQDVAAFGAPISGVTDSSVRSDLSFVSAGETIDIIIFNRGSFNGDQTFGNFRITGSEVPEPTTLAFCAFATVGFVLRRQRREG